MAQFIIRLTLDSNAVGPFDIYTGSTSTTPIKTNQTRDQLIAGVLINLPGATFGTNYPIYIINTQDGCNDLVVSHNIVAYTSYVITIDVTEGSTKATYNAVADSAVSENITVNFKHSLGLTTGGNLEFTPSIPISSGSTTGSLVLTASTSFSLLNGVCENSDFYISGSTGVTNKPQEIYNCNIQSITPTPTASPGVTPTPSVTASITPTPTTTVINITPTPSSSVSVTPTPTATVISLTPTPTNTSTPNSTPTPTNTSTPNSTPTPTNTSTPNSTPTPTNTSTPNSTPTPTNTSTPNSTPTPTNTSTPNSTPTPTNTSTPNSTPTPTNTSTPNSTPTPTNTSTPNSTPTPSVTTSITPTNTSTPNSTPTPTNTSTPNSTPTPTNTSTPNSTPTPTATAAGAPPMLLFMEASSDAVFGGNQNTDIGDWMVNNGTGNWYGYTTSGEPDLSDANQLADFKTWMDWPGFTAGTSNAPAVITSVVSQTSTGTDSYSNSNTQYVFQTLEIPSGSFTTNDLVWFVFVVPHSELASSTKLYTSIGYDFSSTPSNAVTQKTSATSLSKNYDVSYSSSNWNNTTYRVHGNTGTLQRTISTADQSNDFYFRGGDLT